MFIWLLATVWSFTPEVQEFGRIAFSILAYLTCCAGEAAVHSAASSADIQNCEGTSQPACPEGSWPTGWMGGTGAAEAAGGPLGRSPALSKNYSDSRSNRCDHKGCPWVWWGAAGRCGTPVHRLHRPCIRTDGFQGLHAAGHTPYRRVPTTDPQSCCRLWSLLQPLADRVHFKLLCLEKDCSESFLILVYFISAPISWSNLLFHRGFLLRNKSSEMYDGSIPSQTIQLHRKWQIHRAVAKWQQATAASSQRVSWGTKGILLSLEVNMLHTKSG